MPTNFRGSFRDTVPFKKKSETCSWSRHCSGALLEVIRALQFYARKDPVNHYVYAQPKAIQKICTGKFRKGKKKHVPLSLSTVEKCLRLLEDLHIISHELAHSPDNLDHRRGRVVTPHDALCRSYPKACRYVGIDGGSGIWLRDGDKAVLVTDETADIGESAALVQNSGAIPERVRGDSVSIPNEFRANSGVGTAPGTGSGTVPPATTDLKNNEIAKPPVKVPEAPPEDSGAYPCKPPEPCEPPQPPEPVEPAKSEPRSGGGEFIKRLATMWYEGNKERPEITKRKEIAELVKNHGEERVAQIFAIYVKAASPFKTRTDFPFTRFVSNFESFAVVADQPRKEPLTGQEPWLLKMFAEQDKKRAEWFKAPEAKAKQEARRKNKSRVDEDFRNEI